MTSRHPDQGPFTRYSTETLVRLAARYAQSPDRYVRAQATMMKRELERHPALIALPPEPPVPTDRGPWRYVACPMRPVTLPPVRTPSGGALHREQDPRMSGASSILSGPLKLWLYPTIGLAIVGAPVLAAGWSGVFTNGLGMGLGIAVEDAPNIGTSFQEGQQIGADTTGSGGLGLGSDTIDRSGEATEVTPDGQGG